VNLKPKMIIEIHTISTKYMIMHINNAEIELLNLESNRPLTLEQNNSHMYLFKIISEAMADV
jgi:hypothetical protein